MDLDDLVEMTWIDIAVGGIGLAAAIGFLWELFLGGRLSDILETLVLAVC